VPTPTTQPPGRFALTSSAFTDGGDIPSRFTCDGKDVSPPLAWSGEPDGTVAYVLTMRDPDASDFLHWMAWNIPAKVEHLAADASGNMPDGAGEGRSDFGSGRVGYRGPCPPSGTHHYVLTLYALPILMADAADTPSDRLERAAAKIALGTATLKGAYRRH
jgi:Raf kinase inhibitor-like YbhB/YbcL family protein